MAITTYAELKSAIADFLNRDDLTSVIPTFISLAEARIARDLRHWKQEKRAITLIDERYENLPSDWLEVIKVRHTDGGIIQTLSASEMEKLRASEPTSGKPRYMCMGSGQIEFYPTPDTEYEISITYYARIPALSDAEPDNWLLLDAPDALLYGSLINSAPYLADDARSQIWGALYNSAIEGLNIENERAKSAGQLRMRIS
jgi:hypothetical protein